MGRALMDALVGGAGDSYPAACNGDSMSSSGQEDDELLGHAHAVAPDQLEMPRHGGAPFSAAYPARR